MKAVAVTANHGVDTMLWVNYDNKNEVKQARRGDWNLGGGGKAPMYFRLQEGWETYHNFDWVAEETAGG